MFRHNFLNKKLFFNNNITILKSQFSTKVKNDLSKCTKCKGSGYITCTYCKGIGRTYYGEREYRCELCKSSGIISCGICNGSGILI